jgi:hypothetical protein
MSPKSFTFKLTVPRDPAAVPVVTDVAHHAVTYAEMDAEAGAGFVSRVNAAATAALTSADSAASCQIVVTGDADGLSFTIGADVVSQRRAG